jgi:EAL domain-containing protein (putative c-di-GMP-specific phosphodiesterase class I)/GGDEF domain-containing protein
MTAVGQVFAPAGNDGPLVRELISARRITSVFQPIVDLYAKAPIGHEILSRGDAAWGSPAGMFTAARRQGLLWELEQVCRDVAFDAIAACPEADRQGRFFLNATPEVFADTRFARSFNRDVLDKRGLGDARFVLEITEESFIDDGPRFRQIVERFCRDGFRIALDDFGAGQSSLLSLIIATPHFIKLDRKVVHGVSGDQYKQQLVASIVSFASNVDTQLIAEGVESWDDLETLLRMGVRYAQGYLFAPPQDRPVGLTDDVRERLSAIGAGLHYGRGEMSETIAGMVVRRQTIRKGSHTGGDIAHRFLRDAALDHLVVLDGQRPIGLISRQQFYLKTSGPVGFSLYQNRPAELVANSNALIVEDRIAVTTLARLAMDRPQHELYEPVVVTDHGGRFIGTVTIKQLLARSIQIEIETAHAANPLTGLPGNRTIQTWMRDALSRGAFTIVYADLDHFKEYNDAYGFLAGDEMIRLAAEVLGRHAGRCSEHARLGHVGGDDFVLVCPSQISEHTLEEIGRTFDEERLRLFKPKHRKDGCFVATDRQGEKRAIPLVTLSLAVIDSTQFDHTVHPAMLSQIAADLKKKAKVRSAEQGCSCHLREQRSYRHAHDPVMAT